MQCFQVAPIRKIRNDCDSTSNRSDIPSPSLSPCVFYLNTFADAAFGSGARRERVGNARGKVLERNDKVLTVQQVWNGTPKDPIEKQISFYF